MHQIGLKLEVINIYNSKEELIIGGGRVKTIWIILISVVVFGGLIGGGTYYLVNTKVTKDKIDLQAQINNLNTRISNTEKSPTDTQKIEEIETQLETNQWVKIVVNLKVDDVIQFDNQEQLTRSRAEIARTQDNVLSTLTNQDFQLRHKYENIPAFSGSISKSGMEKLISNSLVSSFELVREIYPH